MCSPRLAPQPLPELVTLARLNSLLATADLPRTLATVAVAGGLAVNMWGELELRDATGAVAVVLADRLDKAALGHVWLFADFEVVSSSSPFSHEKPAAIRVRLADAILLLRVCGVILVVCELCLIAFFCI